MAYIESYHAHHSDHDYIMHKTRGEDTNVPYMGFELEVDIGGCNNEMATEVDRCFFVHDDPEFLMFEEDGSICDGFEIITNPGTLEFHRLIRHCYEDAFRKLVRHGYRSYNTNSCGLHIHVNRSYFGDDCEAQNTNIEKVLMIAEKFWDEILVFSRRDSESANRWASKLNESLQEVIEDMRNDDISRYKCVNLYPTNTIEFRIFKGTLNPHSLFASLELVNNICEYALHHSSNEVAAMSWNDLLHGEEICGFWERVKNRSVL